MWMSLAIRVDSRTEVADTDHHGYAYARRADENRPHRPPHR